MINRYLNLSRLLKTDRSAFLFGPRGVGKTSLSRQFIASAPPFLEIDLLQHELFSRYIAHPGLFAKEVEVQLKDRAIVTVFIDEVQKLPVLLDEVHSLMERHKGRVRFLLTGSSARKLKRGGANLLAGRAWSLHLHPLTHREYDVDLSRALQFGTLPAVYLEDSAPQRTLKAYVETYLKEEIMQEALVRRVDAYIRFLDVAGQMNGEPINYTKMAMDCGVSTKTSQEHVAILTDTLIAFRIDAWTYSIRKQLRQSPKIYFFDCGVLNAIRGELATELKRGTYRYGKLFETFVIQEMLRLNDYMETGYRFYYWRTNTGLEVDAVLSRGAAQRPIAVEIKSKEAPQETDLHALKSFQSENKAALLYCLSDSPRTYKTGGVTVYPWREGLARIFEL
ncbi:MAG: ATP-binding protein [Elusimicrobia bacterium]|nr:ATP-binding protein [Elusimicrobiota bacterium]